MAVGHHLRFTNSVNLNGSRVAEVQIHYRAKFHQNRSSGCKDNAIFPFFKMVAGGHRLSLWLSGLNHWPRCTLASRGFCVEGSILGPAGKEVYRLCKWACYRIKFLDRYRGFTCVLHKMWQVAAVKFREPFGCCLRRQWILMFQATWAVSWGPWPCAGWPACYRLAQWVCRGGLAYRAVAWLGTRETKLV